MLAAERKGMDEQRYRSVPALDVSDASKRSLDEIPGGLELRRFANLHRRNRETYILSVCNRSNVWQSRAARLTNFRRHPRRPPKSCAEMLRRARIR